MYELRYVSVFQVKGLEGDGPSTLSQISSVSIRETTDLDISLPNL